MSRRHSAEKRVINPDPKFGDLIVSKFMNNLMEDGKKSVAENIVYGAFDIVQAKAKQDTIVLFHAALQNVAPAIEVRSRRVGGATFQVPIEVRTDRKVSLSMKNLILYSRKRSGKSMSEKLAAEVLAAFNEEGGAFKRKEDMHKMAEANKAFAHFRF